MWHHPLRDSSKCSYTMRGSMRGGSVSFRSNRHVVWIVLIAFSALFLVMMVYRGGVRSRSSPQAEVFTVDEQVAAAVRFHDPNLVQQMEQVQSRVEANHEETAIMQKHIAEQTKLNKDKPPDSQYDQSLSAGFLYPEIPQARIPFGQQLPNVPEKASAGSGYGKDPYRALERIYLDDHDGRVLSGQGLESYYGNAGLGRLLGNGYVNIDDRRKPHPFLPSQDPDLPERRRFEGGDLPYGHVQDQRFKNGGFQPTSDDNLYNFVNRQQNPEKNYQVVVDNPPADTEQGPQINAVEHVNPYKIIPIKPPIKISPQEHQQPKPQIHNDDIPKGQYQTGRKDIQYQVKDTQRSKAKVTDKVGQGSKVKVQDKVGQSSDGEDLYEASGDGFVAGIMDGYFDDEDGTDTKKYDWY